MRFCVQELFQQFPLYFPLNIDIFQKVSRGILWKLIGSPIIIKWHNYYLNLILLFWKQQKSMVITNVYDRFDICAIFAESRAAKILTVGLQTKMKWLVGLEYNAYYYIYIFFAT